MTAFEVRAARQTHRPFAGALCLLAMTSFAGCTGDLPDWATGQPLGPDASPAIDGGADARSDRAALDTDSGPEQDPASDDEDAGRGAPGVADSGTIQTDDGSAQGDAGPSEPNMNDEDAGNEPEPDPDPNPVDSGDRMPVIVASGGNHQLALSIDDGQTWCVTHDDDSMTSHDNPHLLRNVTYANGYFVSGSWRALLRSRNGYAWEDLLGDDEQPVIGQWVAQVAYGNGYWVATGGYGTAMRSSDMLDWENVTDQLPGDDASRSLAFGDGVFVTGRDGNTWWQSSDGTGWTQRSTGSSRLYFDGGEFQDHPGHDCASDGQTCVRNSGYDIERSGDGGSSWTTVATLPNLTERFAFGEAPEADFAAGADIPDAVRGCLGL